MVVANLYLLDCLQQPTLLLFYYLTYNLDCKIWSRWLTAFATIQIPFIVFTFPFFSRYLHTQNFMDLDYRAAVCGCWGVLSVWLAADSIL